MSKSYPLANNGVFATVQGEGALLGIPMVFIRLAGCDINCKQCDTDYALFEKRTTEEIVERVATQAEGWIDWVWITGGEPSMYDLAELIVKLKRIPRLKIAIATAGHRAFPSRGELGYDWLSVSPHNTREWTQFTGAELKIVPGLNGLMIEDVIHKLGNHPMGFGHYFVQSLYENKNSLNQCIQLMKKQPGRWHLTVQAHKQWGLA